MSLPASLAAVAASLRCPVCLKALAPAAGALRCDSGHSYDVARHGYVSLLSGDADPAAGDDAAMVQARAEVEQAGLLAPLTAELVRLARPEATAQMPLVLDVGAGTGHHLAAVLDALPRACGVALDVSRYAVRRAARAHARAAAVRADTWHELPLGDGTVELALTAFAPRNGAELHRVLAPGGRLLVATPTPTHLQELAPLHAIAVDPDKSERLARQLGERLSLTATHPVIWTLALSRGHAAALVRMGPGARHLAPDFEASLAALSEPVRVTAAVEVRVYARGA